MPWVTISYSRGLPSPGVEPMSLASSALAGRFFATVPFSIVTALHSALWVKYLTQIFIFHQHYPCPVSTLVGFPGGSEVKASACNAGDPGSSPGSERSPGEGNGTPLQYSCLENPMGGGAWWATVHGVTKSRTRLSNFTSLHFTSSLPLSLFAFDCT